MNSHPYIKFGETKEWKTIEKALKNLVKNKDLILQTRIELIIGYLVQCLENDKKNKTPSDDLKEKGDKS